MSKVLLVGAGPGDPLLITLKGRQALESANSVLYDHLANEDLLTFAPPEAERIYVGKKKADHAYTQDEICRMMIERARAGRTVVRLKGGDPFIFGRGGEEAEALAAAGINFEVVPGVTVPLGIAAYSGVPLTHRRQSSVVTFVTGHDVDAIDWDKVSGAETLVVFMGLTQVGRIAERLIACGLDPSTPAIAVRWATRPDQMTVAAPLQELAARIAASGMKPPATLILGEVVRLHDRLNWFEKLPLFGRRIVVTRAQGQAGTFAAKLRALGAEAIELPTIAIRPAASYAALDAAIARLPEYDWLLFTSANGVRFFLDRLDASGSDLRAIKARIAVIGPATRAAVESVHLKPDLMPESYVAESLLATFEPYDLKGKRVLLPRAAVARDLIPAEFTKRGARIDVVEAYRTETPEFAREHALEVLSKAPRWVTFTSTSTVANLVATAGKDALRGVKLASIGPITSKAIRERGLEVAAEASRFTIDGLIETILHAESAAR